MYFFFNLCCGVAHNITTILTLELYPEGDNCSCLVETQMPIDAGTIIELIPVFLLR